MSELAELKKQLAELNAKLDAFEQGVMADFDVVTVDGVEYYDSRKLYTHQEALDLAEKHGLRVMESWEMHKMWCESEAFRKSCKGRYWCSSINSNDRSYAWQFNGYYGIVSIINRNIDYGVRCVGRGANETAKIRL